MEGTPETPGTPRQYVTERLGRHCAEGRQPLRRPMAEFPVWSGKSPHKNFLPKSEIKKKFLPRRRFERNTFMNLANPNLIWVVIALRRQIYCWAEFELVLNLSEKCKYNPRFRKYFCGSNLTSCSAIEGLFFFWHKEKIFFCFLSNGRAILLISNIPFIFHPTKTVFLSVWTGVGLEQG